MSDHEEVKRKARQAAQAPVHKPEAGPKPRPAPPKPAGKPGARPLSPKLAEAAKMAKPPNPLAGAKSPKMAEAARMALPPRSLAVGAAKQVAPPAPKPAQQNWWQKTLGFGKDLISGAYEGGRDMVVGIKDLAVGTAKGAWNLTGGWITDPKAAKQTAQSVWSGAKGAWNVASDLAKTNPAYLRADPKGYAAAMARTQQRGVNVWNALSAPYKEAIRTGHWGKALGRGVVDVGSLFLDGAGVAGKVGEGASVAGRLGRAGEALNAAARAGKFGKVGTGAVGAIERARVLTKSTVPITGPRGARMVGPASGRPFDPAKIAVPIRRLDASKIKITPRGIDVVSQHIGRFPQDVANKTMLDRLRQISAGQLKPTPQDLNFYAHELREFVRYRKAGHSTGAGNDHDLWNNMHTATLEDYGLRENTTPSPLYHPEAVEAGKKAGEW